MLPKACPQCESDFQGELIPPKLRKYYGGDATHYSRLIGIENPDLYDGVSYWKCPDCGHQWNRFPPKETNQ